MLLKIFPGGNNQRLIRLRIVMVDLEPLDDFILRVYYLDIVPRMDTMVFNLLEQEAIVINCLVAVIFNLEFTQWSLPTK